MKRCDCDKKKVGVKRVEDVAPGTVALREFSFPVTFDGVNKMSSGYKNWGSTMETVGGQANFEEPGFSSTTQAVRINPTIREKWNPRMNEEVEEEETETGPGGRGVEVLQEDDLAYLLENLALGNEEDDEEDVVERSVQEGDRRGKSVKRRYDLKFFERNGGKLFGFGSNAVSGLDIFTVRPKRIQEVEELYATVASSADSLHSLLLKSDGSVWSFGVNDEFQLMRKKRRGRKDEATPKRVNIPGGEQVVQIVTGGNFSAVLTKTGKVFAAGQFYDSVSGKRSGMSPEWDKTPPTELIIQRIKPDGDEVTFIKIAAGSQHLLLLSEGRVAYSVGLNTYCQLGRCIKAPPSYWQYDVPVVSNLEVGKVVIYEDSEIVDIKAGSNISLFLTKNGNTFGCGLSNYGQLGRRFPGTVVWPERILGLEGPTWDQLAVGEHHILGLDKLGKVYSIGRGSEGQLGFSPPSNEEEFYIWKCKEVKGFEDKRILEVACGENSSYALDSEFRLWSWGSGLRQVLGHRIKDSLVEGDIFEPTLVDTKHLKGKIMDFSVGQEHVIGIIIPIIERPPLCPCCA